MDFSFLRLRAVRRQFSSRKCVGKHYQFDRGCSTPLSRVRKTERTILSGRGTGRRIRSADGDYPVSVVDPPGGRVATAAVYFPSVVTSKSNSLSPALTSRWSSDLESNLAAIL